MNEKPNIPAPPEKPDSFECCGSGCVPCIFDYYYDQLIEWQGTYGITLEEYQKTHNKETSHQI
jgi:hypothetical protein